MEHIVAAGAGGPVTPWPQAAARRVRVAFALQPFLCAALGFMLFPALDATAGPGRTVDPLHMAITFGVLSGVIGGLIAGLLAHPTLLFLTKRRTVTCLETLLFGTVFGALPTAVVLVIQVIVGRLETVGLAQMLAGVMRLTAYGVALGLASAAIFWWIAGRHLARSYLVNHRGTQNTEETLANRSLCLCGLRSSDHKPRRHGDAEVGL